ncbi:HEAT repeat domain-containing protein [Legionella tunisiensis]|uniref:HEAT repeat domain-containing protein n=1 Tax=Legionella tunisiensis TaxID=1034944 RepID=UPI002FBD7755
MIDTLNNDPDPSRRAAAAFLMGHFKDPNEIISLLMVHVNDRDSGVRNNVMRVIAATMFKANIAPIDVVPF